MDSRLIYRKGRDGRQPTPIPAQYVRTSPASSRAPRTCGGTDTLVLGTVSQYPKGLQELVDRMWSSSSSKDRPAVHLASVAADAVQLSPAELSDADLPWSEELDDGEEPPRRSTVTFAERETDGLSVSWLRAQPLTPSRGLLTKCAYRLKQAEDEPQHHGFKHLVERLMKPNTDAREPASPSRDEVRAALRASLSRVLC